jgi:2,3-dihydroxybenzoate decarboxylase
LADFHDERLRLMDGANIQKAILSMVAPGVQSEPDAAVAARMARLANDFLAAQIEAGQGRLEGFAHLAMHDPREAAAELERCVTQLRFKGALINGQTNGVFLDHRQYDVFWERAQALASPIYLHPADPIAPFRTLEDYPELLRATWGWTIETASHALRLIFGGVFDRYPKALVILGHMGETLPFMLWRLDSRYQLYRKERPLQHMPSHYLKTNFLFTTSGQCSGDALRCTLGAVGEDRVMFSVDHPFESTELAASFMEETPLTHHVRSQVAHETARRVFKL